MYSGYNGKFILEILWCIWLNSNCNMHRIRQRISRNYAIMWLVYQLVWIKLTENEEIIHIPFRKCRIRINIRRS